MVVIGDSVIPGGVIILGGAWVLSHLLILVFIISTHYRKPMFILVGGLLLIVYLLKPYTYDLEKYSIYFATGYIPTIDWHMPHEHFQLDSSDTTGDPYDGYELGFNLFSKVGTFVMPGGSLVPRYDANYWDLKERGPPRHDGMVLLLVILSASSLIYTSRSLLRKSGYRTRITPDNMAIISLVIVGSVFFFVGSQNAIRQFLGLVIVLSAMNVAISKKYFVSIVLVVVASMFHRWAAIFGIMAVMLVLGLGWSLKYWPMEKIRPFHLTRFELVALLVGIVAFLTIKILVVLGAFHSDLPLISDLKAYVVYQEQYQMYERPGPWLKLVAIMMLFGLTEALQGAATINRVFDVRLLRRVILFLIVPLSVYPEIFARMLFFYWIIEAVFVVWALLSEESRTKLAGAMVFMTYGIAPNALNVLLGPEWLQSF